MKLRSIPAFVLVATAMLFAHPARADKFDVWVAGLWPDAQALGVSRTVFDASMKGVRPDFRLPDLDLPSRRKKKKSRGQPEFIKPPKFYLRESTLVSLTKRGRGLQAKWKDSLAKIKKRFGVEPGMVLAIWGRETAFGGYKLPHNAIRALATQAYVGRRKDKFRRELLLGLKILQEGHITKSRMRSSWAGAMGMTQLLPSNFYDHAVDLDGDGRKNIWTSVPDALASAAKSLVDNGWAPDRTWGYEVRKPKTFDCSLEGPQNARAMTAWAAMGFTRAFGRQWSDAQLSDQGYLLLPEGTRGPAFLMHNNFLVIKSYNFADLYALFVGNLADRIAASGKFETPWATNKQLPKRRIAEIQDWLNKAGYKAGKVDGRAGTITRNAIGMYQKANKLTLDCYPSVAVWKHLSGRRKQAAN
ncbi:MAG: lytic murein transglycosylase [Hyphomicrobiaceae bacterium]